MKKIMFDDRFGLTEAVLAGRKMMTRRIINCPKKFRGGGVRLRDGFESAFGRKCRDFTSLSIARLHDDGHVDGGWVWAQYDNYELVDKDHCEENIAKIREYHVSGYHQPPYYLDSRIERMYYQ